ncbi:phenylacetic acid degradation B [Thermaerobacter marianensis DSM 12885]|uniref:Phenylacetic acid degradation B n=1 Tax=Thermaerobacter marianensis (strain ATCC 700841 / DSM 12885 / JCM 10246 / 7p75a) TaxID=644966 RepID=E6SJY3_THEM7|nr:phenylacetic acid degradation protein PaaB [Thermaerobacter marianensis]ADU52216.1 phenylacetic acid degradation B [Thermaerobacter marianensis DSM 12885]
MGGTMEVYEVFGQPRRGEPYLHCGSLLAGDRRSARLLALQLYCRRQEYVSLWVVPRACIEAVGEGDDDWWQPATDKTYRLGEGFARTRVLWQRFGRGPGGAAAASPARSARMPGGPAGASGDREAPAWEKESAADEPAPAAGAGVDSMVNRGGRVRVRRGPRRQDRPRGSEGKDAR